jgi:hypothetical protein
MSGASIRALDIQRQPDQFRIDEVTTRFQKRVKQLSTNRLVCYAVTILVAEGHRAHSKLLTRSPLFPYSL